MARGRGMMLGVGAALIVGILLAATFSLGVYVGEHGWTWQGVSLAGPAQRPGGPPPGQAPPGGGAPPPGGAGLPPRSPDLRGQVRALEDGTLFLATSDGPRTVELAPQVQVRTTSGESLGIAALQPGAPVAVFGHRGDGGQVLVADVVVLFSP